MYRPRAYAVDDIGTLHAFIRKRVFATVAVAGEGTVHFAYAPVVLDENGTLGRVRFHLARVNPVTSHADGATLHLSFLGSDTYVSPDWYESKGRVPTWNYMAVEARGVAHKLGGDALHQLLVDLSVQEEEHLRPKKPWTLDKVPEERLAALLNAIEGFEVALESLEGKFKLSQNMPPEDIAGVIAGLEARDDTNAKAITEAMKR
ncbi:MAG TPA: FMN-binding negative transcriptional regulator [Rhizomicrobium sp.]